MGMKEPSADARNRLLLDVTGASPSKAASGQKIAAQTIGKRKDAARASFLHFYARWVEGRVPLIPIRWLRAACRRRRTPRGRYR